MKKLRNIKGKKLSKREAYYVISRFYHVLKNQEITLSFHKHKGLCGTYDASQELITLDHRRDFIPTIIHEMLHFLHPEWCESKVLSHERKIATTLTPRQAINMMKAICIYFSKKH